MVNNLLSWKTLAGIAMLATVLFGGLDGRVDVASAQDQEAYTEEIPGTVISFEMVPVSGGTATVTAADGSTEKITVDQFWIGKTEVSWDLYDIYVYSLREDGAETSDNIDAVTRPSKPYVLPGESFGHKGYPALGMTHNGAVEFAEWLSAVTGKTYKVPTESQWEHACKKGLVKQAYQDTSVLSKYAWYAGNSGDQTHPVGSSSTDQLGLHDMLGNVAEWATVPEGDPVIKGGSYRKSADEIRCTTREKQKPFWNASDPQIPKSKWWLPDAPFVGMRVVRIPEGSND